MADNQQDQQFPTDPNQEYHYTPLGVKSLASPGQPLPGYRRPANLSGDAQRKQAAAAHAASQAAAQAKHDAQVKRDQASPSRKRGKK